MCECAKYGGGWKKEKEEDSDTARVCRRRSLEMIKQGEKKGWEADRRTEQWQMGVFWSVTNVPRKN